jgi:hypothetical protein
MHVPLQLMVPGVHASEHMLLAQTYPGPKPAATLVQSVPWSPFAQFPVAPQKFKLDDGSMHVWFTPSKQLTRPAVHVSWQDPPEQTSPAGHVVPALTPVQGLVAPQYFWSVCGLTHVPPQTICPESQLALQTPSVQTVPAAHAIAPVQVLPEAPQ